MKIQYLPLIKLRHWMRIAAVLAMLACSAEVGMAQRGKGRLPSPAEPGMVLPQAPSKKGGSVHRDKPTDPQKPQPESPQPADPNAGIGPEEAEDVVVNNDSPVGEDDDALDDVIAQSPLLPPKITKWQIFKLGVSPEFGQPGDWMLVLTGMHFLEAESQPILHLGDKIALDDVMVGEKGTELYAVIPKAMGPKIALEGFGRMCLQNPGGMNRDPKGWQWLPVDAAEFKKALEEAVEAKLNRGPFFMQMQR